MSGIPGDGSGSILVEYHLHRLELQDAAGVLHCVHVHLDGIPCAFTWPGKYSVHAGAGSYTMATSAAKAAQQAYQPDPRYDRSAVLAEVSGHTDQPMHVIEAVLDALTEIGVHPADWARPAAAPTGP